jgi:hypothetical protein
MTLIALYAEKYGGAPRDEQPWHEVVALLDRIPGLDARERLLIAHGTALGQPVDSSQMGMREMELMQIKRLAAFDKGPVDGV